jgi:prepilin-type N-terminal cleavage/methylation domain-containing protein
VAAMKRQAGFTLVELMVSLVLLLLGLALAAQILMESAQLFAEAAGEQTDAPIPLAIARLRGDVLASSSFQVATGEEGLLLVLEGHPAGTVFYERVGEELRRGVLDAAGDPGETTAVLRGVSQWVCLPASPRLVVLGVRYRRHAVPRSPLPRLPAFRGPATEERQEWLALAPRGGGLGDGW